MSRWAIVAVVLVLVAGVLGLFLNERYPSDPGDGQEALVIPFIIFWTLVAVGFVLLIDFIARGYKKHKAREGDDPPHTS